MIDERRRREIAKSHAWPEDQFVASVRRLVEGYGYTLDQALQQVQMNFIQRYGLGPTPAPGPEPAGTKLSYFMPAPGGKPGAGEEVRAPPSPQTEEAGGAGPASGEKTAPQQPEVMKEGGGDEAKTPTQSPDPRLTAWLEAHGFSRRPDGTAWQKTVRLEDGRIIKLVVDFKNSKGLRYAYQLDEESGQWKSVEALRDHPTLLEYKKYRDDLLASEQKEAVVVVPAGAGQLLLQKTEEEERAELVDRMDEQEMIRDIQGEIRERILEKYFYKFQHRGRTVIGLSWEGIKAIVRRLGNVVTNLERLEEKEEGWLAVVKAKDLKRNLEVVGVFFQPKSFPDGSPNPFAPTLAVVKAQRDAWRCFIPERVLVETYREWEKLYGGGAS